MKSDQIEEAKHYHSRIDPTTYGNLFDLSRFGQVFLSLALTKTIKLPGILLSVC